MTLSPLQTCALATAALALLAGIARANAPPDRYTVSGGEVVDHKTGLTWQRSYSDNVSLTQAKSYCASLVGGWRVPTIKELQTIVDQRKAKAPYVDEIAFPLKDADNSPILWSSTDLPGTDLTWVVAFGFGDTLAYPAGATNYHVRCVQP